MAVDPNLDKFIGKGITFPIQLDNRGAAVVDGGVELLRKSLLIIITWPYGTRFFLNQFGSRIEELLDEPNDLVLHSMINHFIIEAITRWEKRVKLIETRVISKGGDKLEVSLRYTIISTQLEDSFVFPFYKQIIN